MFDTISRKITFFNASATCWVASATIEMAAELQPDEQASLDMHGELSYSLSEIRKEVRNWEEVATSVHEPQPKSSTFVCCRERELRGFVHEDYFTITGDSTQLAQMNLDGANVKSVMTPTVKMQEWTPQVLAKIDKDRTSTLRSATMRARNMSINRVDVQHAVRKVARCMAEPNEREHGACSSVWFDTLYQEEHDVCSSFPWRQLAQSWKVDARYAQSMMIVFGEDAGQRVLGTESSSATSISEKASNR